MWPDASEIQMLLERLRDGAEVDPAVRDAFWARHRDTLQRLIAMRLDPLIRRRADASDIVQGVLLEAHRRLPGYLSDPALPFHLWLRRIALDHIAVAHRRHRQAGCRSLDRERGPVGSSVSDDSRDAPWSLGQIADSALTPGALAIRDEAAAQFREALGRLDPDDREILVLRYIEHMSNHEAAHALDLSPAAAGMRHLRALRRLKRVLEPADRSGSSC